MERKDVVVIGGGHNGEVTAAYCAKAGLSVTILEKQQKTGGAAISEQIFQGIDIRPSVYAYLLSLFPKKIIRDLGLNVESRRRENASFTPREDGSALLVSNVSKQATQESFRRFTGNDREYENFCRFYQMTGVLARILWPCMLTPLRSRQALEKSLNAAERPVWKRFVNEPIGRVIEECFADDHVRGLVATDAKIGAHTHMYDPTGLQNRVFALHVIGNETGEWQVPVGGMGQVTDALRDCALRRGVDIQTGCDVTGIEIDGETVETTFIRGDREEKVASRYVVSNVAITTFRKMIKGAAMNVTTAPGSSQGAAVKVNMALKHSPRMKSKYYTAEQAFAGTFHVDEEYSNIDAGYWQAEAGEIPERPGGEMYCHTITDKSIMSDELAHLGYQTLTFFGLNAPYALFKKDPQRAKAEILDRYMKGINRYTLDPIQDCLALDANGQPCISVMSPFDLQEKLGMPEGNIFHGPLQWPFAENPEDVGTWGVETGIDNILICGSSAKRGGGVSGITGHNAAMRLLEMESGRR